MFNFKSFFVVVLLSMLASAGARAESCDKVEVEVTPFTHVTKSKVPARHMSKLMLAGGAYNFSEEGMALGMVVATEDHSINVRRDEAGCRVFHVKTGFAPATLYVAAELVETHCGYRHIRDHELEHVRIYSDFVSKLAQPLQQALTAILADHSQSDNEAVGALMYQAMSEQFAKVYQTQHDLDSNRNYEKNERVCGGVLMSIVKSL